MYIPPSFALRSEYLNSLFQQLPSPFFLLGDFNGHNVLWGSKGNDPREDLSLCHPSVFLDYVWSVCEDQHGSDHFPIIIESIQHSSEDHNPKWKLNKADWDLFHSLCEESLTAVSLSDSVDPIAGFTSSLIDICGKCIHKTSTSPTKSNPWYNEDCFLSLIASLQSLSKFCKYPTKENLNNVRLCRAKARRTIKSAKRKSWRTYVSKLTYKTPIKKVWDMIRKISW